jgi:hypothetical protein
MSGGTGLERKDGPVQQRRRQSTEAVRKPPCCRGFRGEWEHIPCFFGQRPPYQGVQRKDMHPIAPRRRPFRPHCHFMHLFRLALTRSRPASPAKQTIFWPIWPSWQVQRPSPAQQLRKNRWGGGVPPLRPPLRRCAAPWLGYAQPKTPKRGDLVASPHMGGGFNCHSSE